MTREITNEGFSPRRDDSEGLRNQVFNPAERQSMLVGDTTNPRELLDRNEALIMEINNHATRIAEAACKTLSGVPTHLQESFMNGISCFNEPHDVVYNAMREQWAAQQSH
ncbi:MAG: hypothetical protein KGS72_18800 [Cyanobacteria bacterium REEB67]|nr:hypothetical protein [Cyanobacteria bacterium REEB67]